MSYKLMIKTHNITGMKYLCITSKDSWQQYKGSGTYWLNHLKTHGLNIKTDLIYESENYMDFLVVCKATSNYLNVVLSEEFANLVPESGYNNNDGKPNVVLFWEYASEELKHNIREKRRPKQIKNHWVHSTKSNEIKNKISEKLINNWSKLNLYERRKLTENLRRGLIDFHENEELVKNWKNKISSKMIAHFSTIPFNILSERNRKSRLNLSEKSKIERKKKIQNVYATGKHDALFKKMSIDRMGSGNPAAKSITINKIKYGSIQEASRITGIAAHLLYRRRKKEIEKNKID